MKKTTIIVLLAFGALLAAVLLMERKTDHNGQSTFSIPGTLEEGATEAKTTTDVKDPGFDTIVLERKGTKMVLVREAAKDGGEDTWKLSEPRESAIEQFKVKQMFLPLQTKTESVFAKDVKAEDLPVYGLGPDEATRVEITKGGAVWASFTVGAAEKSEDPEAGSDEVDTWVLDAEGGHVFRMAGKDLHAAFALELSDLRDKKLFSFEKKDIRKLTLRDGASTVVLVDKAPPAEPPKVEEGQPAPPPAASEGQWVFEQPADKVLGSPSTLLATLAGLRVTEFKSLDDAKDGGLGDGDKPYAVEATLTDGKTVTLLLGKEDGPSTWCKLAGGDEAFTISKYTAEQLHKTVDDLREKKVLGIKADGVAGVAFASSGLEIKRVGDDWQAVTPPGITVGKDEVHTLLRDLEGFTVSDFVSPVPPPAETGLDPATAKRVTITTAGGQVALLIGKEADAKVWVMREGADEAWRASTYAAKKLDRTADDLRDKQVFSFPRDAIAKIVLQKGTGGEETTLERDPAEADATKAWKIVVPTGLEGDAGKIGSLVTTLVNLKAKAMLPEKKADEAGLVADKAFRVAVSLADGSTQTLLISEDQYQGDNYAVVADGSSWKRFTFTLNQYQAKNLTKTSADLKK